MEDFPKKGLSRTSTHVFQVIMQRMREWLELYENNKSKADIRPWNRVFVV